MTSLPPPFTHADADEEDGWTAPGPPVPQGSAQPQVSAHHSAWDDITKKLCLLGQGCPCTPCPADLGGVVTGTPPNRKCILMELPTPVLPYCVPSTHPTQGGGDGRGRGPGGRDQKWGEENEDLQT